MHVTNWTVHFVHQTERQKKQGLLLCGYACQLWWSVYTVWSLCTKISRVNHSKLWFTLLMETQQSPKHCCCIISWQHP